MKKYKDLEVTYSLHDTILGRIFIASSNLGVCCVNFISEDYNNPLKWLKKYFLEENLREDSKSNVEVANQINEYFKGKRHSFDIKLHTLGTDFQKQVWNILETIEHGEVWTYKDIASKLGDEKKCRAVGGAIGKNPIVIIIPCHRVIGSNGGLTGFSAPGGIKLKRQLLDLENIKAE